MFQKPGIKKKLGFGILGCLLGFIFIYYMSIECKYQDIVEQYNENYAVAEMTELEKIDSMREYVYTNSVFANGEELLLNGFSPEIFGLSKKEKVVKMFQLAQNYKGGLYCDGFADMLAMFYQTMGYDSYRVNLNVHGNTHCVTVVKCNEDWIIEDATFNLSYVMDKTEDTELEKLISNLRYEKGNAVKAVEGCNTDSLAISHSTQEEWTSLYPVIDVIGEKNGCYMYKIDRSVSHYEMYEEMYPHFIEDGYEPDYKFSLLYAEDIIWKYGIEDLIFDRKDTLKDVSEISAIIIPE